MFSIKPSVSRVAPDTRADNGCRSVSVTPGSIGIDRVVGGIKMRLVVPVSRYRGVVLVCETLCGAPFHRVVLDHRDPDLRVDLDAGFDRRLMAEALHRWARYFGQPERFIEASGDRRRARTPARRRRAVRLPSRPCGHPLQTPRVLSGEDEIICYE